MNNKNGEFEFNYMATKRGNAQDKAFPHDWGEGVTRRLRSKLLVTEEGCYLGENQILLFSAT